MAPCTESTAPGRSIRRGRKAATLLLACVTGCSLQFALAAQEKPGSAGQPNQTTPAGQMPGSKNAGSGKKPGEGTSESKPAASGSATGETGASAGGRTASGRPGRLNPLAPSIPPPRVFARPRIGLALGGGGALGLSEVGVLQWFDEHRIPVDVIAGTSIGCLVASLYATGRTPEELKNIVNDKVFGSVFSFHSSYTARSYRRRQDTREIPNALTIGLRHGISFRNAVLTDQGLNAFLDREFVRYDDRTSFNTLPIPLRCVATDLTDARAVTFARGSIPDAVRASVSLPAVYQPFSMDGHEYVDGGVLENLPTAAVRDMGADVVLAVSLPLAPAAPSDLSSILGVLQRSFSVAIEGAEREQRKLANVVIEPDLKGFGATDYLENVALAERGYAAAQAAQAQLLPYALSSEDWHALKAHQASLLRPAPGPLLRVRVTAPAQPTERAVLRLFRPLVDEPLDTAKIETLLDQVRADGRYDADYTVGYESAHAVAERDSGAAPNGSGSSDVPAAASDRPLVLVTVTNKKTGPPFLLLGGDVQAQTGGIDRASLEGILLYPDLGGYGSELRSQIRLGYITELSTEYFRPLYAATPERTWFAAPRAGLLRHPYPIYVGDEQIDHRQLQTLSAGGDIGLTNRSTSELRVGYEFSKIHWYTIIGQDHRPDYDGTAQRVSVRYKFDNQDRAVVPQFGASFTGEGAYLFSAVGSENAPQLHVRATYAHLFSFSRHPFPSPDDLQPTAKQIVLAAVEAGTMFGRRVAAPYQFTLGGPLRLTASAIDQYRGTDYFLLEPALLRRIAELPQPLGQSIYVGGGYELGQIRSFQAANITRQDFFFGLFAETPVGVITLTQSIGNHDEHKFTFTLGKLF